MISKSNVKADIPDGLPIAIDPKNRALLQQCLDTLQGRAYADVLTADDVMNHANAAERSLESAGIAPSYRIGASFSVSPSGPSANAYKYSRDGTVIQLERKSRGWLLVRAFRVTVWPRQRGRQVLTMTFQQKRLVLRSAIRAHGISLEEACLAIDELRSAA